MHKWNKFNGNWCTSKVSLEQLSYLLISDILPLCFGIISDLFWKSAHAGQEQCFHLNLHLCKHLVTCLHKCQPCSCSIPLTHKISFLPNTHKSPLSTNQKGFKMKAWETENHLLTHRTTELSTFRDFLYSCRACVGLALCTLVSCLGPNTYIMLIGDSKLPLGVCVSVCV